MKKTVTTVILTAVTAAAAIAAPKSGNIEIRTSPAEMHTVCTAPAVCEIQPVYDYIAVEWDNSHFAAEFYQQRDINSAFRVDRHRAEMFFNTDTVYFTVNS